MPKKNNYYLDNFDHWEKLQSGKFCEVSIHKAKEGPELVVFKTIIKPCWKLACNKNFHESIEIRLKSLRNENIVAVRGFRNDSKKVKTIILEYCELGDLKVYLAANSTVPDPLISRFSLHIAKGLNFLHEKNFVHRNIRPENVFLTKQLGEIVVKLGLPKAETGEISGSHYCAPECENGLTPYSQACDVWAYGVLVAEMKGLSPKQLSQQLNQQGLLLKFLTRILVDLNGRPKIGDILSYAFLKYENCGLELFGSFPCRPKVMWRSETNAFQELLRTALDVNIPVVVVSSEVSGLCKASAICEIFYSAERVKPLSEQFTGVYWWDLAIFEESYFESESFVRELLQKTVIASENNDPEKKRNILVLDGFPLSKVEFLLERYKGESALKAIVISRRKKDVRISSNEKVATVHFNKLTNSEYGALVPKLFKDDEDMHSQVKKLSCGLPYLLFMLRNLNSSDLSIIVGNLQKENREAPFEALQVLRQIVRFNNLEHLVPAILPYRPYEAMSTTVLSIFVNSDSRNFGKKLGNLNLRMAKSNQNYGCHMLFEYAWTCFNPPTKNKESPMEELGFFDSLSDSLSKLTSFNSWQKADFTSLVRKQAKYSVNSLYEILTKSANPTEVEQEFVDSGKPKINIIRFIDNIAIRDSQFLRVYTNWLKGIFQPEESYEILQFCAQRGYFRVLDWFFQNKYYRSDKEAEIVGIAVDKAASVSRSTEIVGYLLDFVNRNHRLLHDRNLITGLESTFLRSTENGDWAVAFCFLKFANVINLNCYVRGKNALYFAVKQNYLPICETLRKKGVAFDGIRVYSKLCEEFLINPESIDQDGITKLINSATTFAQPGEAWVLFDLLLKQCSPDFMIQFLQSNKPLLSREVVIKFFEADIPEISDFLLKVFDIDSYDDKKQNTPLMDAVMARNDKLVSALIKNNCDIEKTQVSSGKTALHLAVEIGTVEIVDILLRNGADQSATDNEGCSILETAVDVQQRLQRSNEVVAALIIMRKHSEIAMLQNFRALAVADGVGTEMIIKHISGHESELSEHESIDCFKCVLRNRFEAQRNKGEIDIGIVALLNGFKQLWPSKLAEILKVAMFLAADYNMTDVISYLVSNQGANVSELNSDEETILTQLLKKCVAEEKLVNLINDGRLDPLLGIPKSAGHSGECPIDLAAKCNYHKAVSTMVNRNIDGSYVISDDERKLAFSKMIETTPTAFLSVVAHLDATNRQIALDCAVECDSDSMLVAFNRNAPWKCVYEKAKKSGKLKVVSYVLCEYLIDGLDPLEELTVLIREGSLNVIRAGKPRFKEALLAKPVNEKSPILLAVERNQQEIVDELIVWGMRKEDALQAVCLATELNRVEIVNLFVSFYKENDSQGILKSLIQAIIIKGAEANSQSVLEQMFPSSLRGLIAEETLFDAYGIALKKENHSVSELLKANTSSREEMARSAIRKGDRQMLSDLLKSNFPFSFPALRQGSNTVLMIAVRSCYPLSSLEFLIDNKLSDIDAQNDAGKTALHLAAEINSSCAAELLLDRAASPRLKDNNQRTALYVAVERNNLLTVGVFKEKLGNRNPEVANIGIDDDPNKEPLFLAFFEKKHFQIARLLMEMGARIQHTFITELFQPNKYQGNQMLENYLGTLVLDVNYKIEASGDTLLMSAVKHNPSNLSEVLTFILNNPQIDLCATNNLGLTALHVAIQQNRITAIESILKKLYEKENGSLIVELTRRTKTKTGESPLLASLDKEEILRQILNFCRKLEVVEQLVEHRDTPEDGTVLMVAAKMGSQVGVRLLLEFGANINAVDHEGNSALTEAVLADNATIVEILTEKGAKIQNALLAAIACKNPKNHELARKLLDPAENPEEVISYRSIFGDNALALAVRLGDIVFVKLLLGYVQDNSSLLNEFNCAGLTPLTIACLTLNLETMKLLITKGASPVARPSLEDDTVLLTVIRHFSAELEFDYQQGSEVSVTSQGWPPAGKVIEIVELLLKHGASPFDTDKFRNNALLLACASSNFNSSGYNLPRQIVRCLRNHDKSNKLFNCCNNRGTTPLMVAAIYGNLELLQTLLNGQADYKAKDVVGNSALSLAIECNQAKIESEIRGFM